MTTLATYQRLVIKGLGPGSEIWQTGLSTAAITPPPDQPALQALCNAAAPLVDTWWAAVKAFVFNSYTFTEVDMYQYVYPSTGAQFQAQSLRTPSAGSVSAAGGAIDQCAVVSIRSATPGRSGRGRMYVPCHISIAPTGQFSSASANTTIGTATKALMNALASGTSALPVVVSRTKGQFYPPTMLITDTKPDVQRRRQNRLLPTSEQVLAFP